MSDEPDDVVLVLLRRVDRDVADLQDRVGRIERRLAVTELRQRIERPERRADLTT